MRDIKVRIKTLRRRARILYLPAYVVDYNFGLSFNSHGERRPKTCQAIISGMGEALLLLTDGGSRLSRGPESATLLKVVAGQGVLLSGDLQHTFAWSLSVCCSFLALLHSRCEAIH